MNLTFPNGAKVDIGPRPTTALQLLQTVRALVLAEPKRLDMEHWVRQDDKQGLVSASACYDAVPECGTVGCIAGWCTIVAGYDPTYAGFDAAKLLGGTKAEINAFDKWECLPGTKVKDRFSNLFYPKNWPADLRERLAHTQQGTPEYATIVAERIDRFIADNKRRLAGVSLAKRRATK